MLNFTLIFVVCVNMRNKSTLRFLCNSFIKKCEKKPKSLQLVCYFKTFIEATTKKEKLQDSRSIKKWKSTT